MATVDGVDAQVEQHRGAGILDRVMEVEHLVKVCTHRSDIETQ